MIRINSKKKLLTILLLKILAQISNASKLSKIFMSVKFIMRVSNLKNEWEGHMIFEALKISTFRLETVKNLHHRESYRSLFELVRRSNIFTNEQKFQMEVYLQFFEILNQVMRVDDSFILSKLLAKLKSEIDTLPDVQPIEKLEYNAMLRNARDNIPNIDFVNKKRTRTLNKIQSKYDELDKIRYYRGLSFIFEINPPKIKKASSKKIYDGTLNDEQILSIRRELIIEILESLKIIYMKSWTRSSIQIIWEHAQTRMMKFIPGHQHKRLKDLYINDKQLIELKEITFSKRNFENTSYEDDEKKWSQQKVSGRRKIGSEVDSKSTTWLG